MPTKKTISDYRRLGFIYLLLSNDPKKACEVTNALCKMLYSKNSDYISEHSDFKIINFHNTIHKQYPVSRQSRK